MAGDVERRGSSPTSSSRIAATTRTRIIGRSTGSRGTLFRDQLILEYEIPEMGRRPLPAQFLCAALEAQSEP